MRLITLLFLILLSTCVRAQVVNTLPTIDNPQDADRIGTYTRGFGAAFRLDSLKTYFNDSVFSAIALRPTAADIAAAGFVGEERVQNLPQFIKSYNPFFFEKIQDVETADKTFLFLGASRVEGRKTPPVFRAQYLNTFNPESGGEGFVSFGSTVVVSTLGTSLTGGTRIDATAEGSLYGASKHALSLDAIGDDYSISSQDRSDKLGHFTNLVFWYLQQAGGGTFTVTVDGSLIQTVDTDGTAGLQRVSLPVMADATHTVVWEKTTAGDVILTDYITSRPTGTSVHIVGNGGVGLGNYVNNFQGNIFEETLPDIVVIRLGVNGGGISAPETTAGQFVRLKDSILIYSPATKFIITGETDNTVGANTTAEIRVFNSTVKKIVEENGMAFANLFDLIPDWSKWRDLGYASSGDNVHENSAGGQIIGRWYLDYLLNSTFDAAAASGEVTGPPSKIAAFDSNGDLTGIDNAELTSEGLLYFSADNNTNFFGAASNATPGVARLSLGLNAAGYPEFVYGGEYNSSGELVSTISNASIKRVSSGILSLDFQISDANVTAGSQAAGYVTPLSISADRAIIPTLRSDLITMGTNGVLDAKDVINVQSSQPGITLRGTDSGNRYAGINLKNSYGDFYIRHGRGVGNQTGLHISLSKDAGELFTFSRTGFFGIGRVVPAAPLDVQGAAVIRGQLNVVGNKITGALAAESATDVPNFQQVLDSISSLQDGTGTDDQTLQEVTDEGAITNAVITAKGLTAKNTSGAGVLRANRTDGKIAILAAGGSYSVFAYDETGEFNIGSNDRTTLESDAITGTESRLFIDQSGNVGLSDIAPTQRLDVNGGARVRDTNKGAAASLIGRLADGTLTDAAPPGPTRVTRTANLTRTSASVATDASLTTASLAAGLYKFKAVLVYRGSDVDTDLEYEVERTYSLNDFSMSRSNDATSVRGLQGYPYVGDVATTSSTATHIVIIEGTFYNNLGNAIKIDWGGTDAVGSITMVRGSYLETEKID
jgi:hypothetical protein